MKFNIEVIAHTKGNCVCACLEYLGINMKDVEYTEITIKTYNNKGLAVYTNHYCFIELLKDAGYNVFNCGFDGVKSISDIPDIIDNSIPLSENSFIMVMVRRHAFLMNSNCEVLVNTSPKTFLEENHIEAILILEKQ